MLFTRAAFDAIFVALFNAIFVTSVNQPRFLCDSGATIAAICFDFLKIAAKLHEVSNIFETSATSCA